MNDELKELVSKADRGDSAAQKELMKRGDDSSTAGDHQQAAYLYKMAAMAYRISEGRTSGILSDTARACARFATTIRLYDEWVKKYTRPLAPRINALTRKKLASDASSYILQLRNEEKFQSMVRYLEEKLMDHDVEFCTGSTLNKHMYYMAKPQADPFWDFKHDIDMRVVLDPICDEIMRMADNYEAQSDFRR